MPYPVAWCATMASMKNILTITAALLVSSCTESTPSENEVSDELSDGPVPQCYAACDDSFDCFFSSCGFYCSGSSGVSGHCTNVKPALTPAPQKNGPSIGSRQTLTSPPLAPAGD